MMDNVYFPYSKKEAEIAGIDKSPDLPKINRESEFAQRMRKLRKRKSELIGENITQVKAAKALGISDAALSYYETGDTVPELKLIIPIAEYYNTTVNYLLGIDERPNYEDDYIAKTTGLSDEAIKQLSYYKKGYGSANEIHLFETLNYLLSSGDGLWLIELLWRYLLGDSYNDAALVKVFFDQQKKEGKRMPDLNELTRKLVLIDIENVLYDMKKEIVKERSKNEKP